MKFQIDTIAKEIHVIETCNLGELISTIEKFLPEWREYNLVNKFAHEFSNPIIIKEVVKEPYPYVPYYPNPITHPPITFEPTTICKTTTDVDLKGLLNAGVYNFQS